MVARSRPLTCAEECRTVLAWQQLCFSLAAPALVAAVVETRLWRRHQEERRQSSLPPEGGWQSSFYRALQELLRGHDWPHIVVLIWLLSGVLHLAAVVRGCVAESCEAAMLNLSSYSSDIPLNICIRCIFLVHTT